MITNNMKTVLNLSDEEIRTIFTSVVNGVNMHGSFLVNLAHAVVHADYSNFLLMKPILQEIIFKYKLYLPEYRPK